MQSSKDKLAAALARPASQEAGFSVIEGLIAALLLLVVTLGILPLFSRAMNNNVKGNDSTRQSNGAIDAFETSVALPFNSGDMTITGGTTQTVVLETMALQKISSPDAGLPQTLSNRWQLAADVVAPDVPVMNRQRTLQQFSFDDFADNQDFNNPLDGSVEPRLVHLKAVDIQMQDASNPLALTYDLRVIQAY